MIDHLNPEIPQIPRDSGRGLQWSHEALQGAHLYRMIRTEPEQDPGPMRPHLTLLRDAHRAAERGDLASADRLAERADRESRKLEDTSRPGTVLIGEGGGVFGELPPLTLQAIAAWLYGTPVALETNRLHQVLSRSEHDRCRDLLARIVSHDHTDRGLDPALAAVLDEGLERWDGEYLRGTEVTLYLHLFCRDYRPTRLRVCERCQLVHEARRARTCRRCRKSPARPQPRPWHTRITIGTNVPARLPALTRHGHSLTVSLSHDRVPRKTVYTGLCACGNPFEATRASTRYCHCCGSPRGRTARASLMP